MAALKKKRRNRKKPKLAERSLSEIISAVNQDGWISSGLQIDAEVFQTVFSMRAAMRDAWLTNPYMAKYAEQISSDTFGEHGIMLRSRVKETEDRVVYAAKEKWALIEHEKRINRLRVWAEKQSGKSIAQYNAFKLADGLDRAKSSDVIRGAALIEVGAPDLYARQRIEAWWEELQRAEFIDIRGRRTMNMLRQIMLWSSARDGGHFIRHIKDTRVNKMGYAIQLVNDEWCDHFYNTTLDNGNVVRMGIEYPFTPWGIGQPVAYHFIRRIPRDWQTAARYGGGMNNSYSARDRVMAEEIIHYARFMDTESTRPAPWGISILGKIRQLDQYEIASVVAARAEACKTGWLESDIVPEGGVPQELLPTSDSIRQLAGTIKITPGGLYGLPYGVKFKGNDPKYPSANFEKFRQGMGQAASAGLPGANYYQIFNDGNMSFSSGRTTRLDSQENIKMLQRWHIETAENSIFENGLEMALIMQVVPLPPKKYSKFNAKVFQGRRWKGIDEVKDANAAALRIANKLSSRNKECAEEGFDFEANALELAEEEMLLNELGLTTETSTEGVKPIKPDAGVDDSVDGTNPDGTPK
jgi:lambda family phage portal protein